MKKIICAIPVYNEEKILENYLENLLNQDPSNVISLDAVLTSFGRSDSFNTK